MSIFNTGVKLLKKTKVIPVFLTINNGYAPYAAAAIHSLTRHSNKGRYYRVIILHDGLTLDNYVRLRNLATKNVAIQFKKMTNNLHLKVIVAYCMNRKKGAGDFFSSAVYYYRAFIPRLFPQYEKGIYIDSDTILLGDIGELFDIDLGEKALAAMPDPKVTAISEFRDYVDNALGVPHAEYVNSGVQLMSLKEMRRLRYLSTMIDLIREYDADLVAPDQDYLNIILKGHIAFIGREWNAEPTKKMPEGTKLVHFNLFNKPWHYKNVAQENLFWNAARGTGFYGDLKRQQAAFGEEEKRVDQEKVAALIEKAGKLSKVKNPLLKMKETKE